MCKKSISESVKVWTLIAPKVISNMILSTNLTQQVMMLNSRPSSGNRFTELPFQIHSNSGKEYIVKPLKLGIPAWLTNHWGNAKNWPTLVKSILNSTLLQSPIRERKTTPSIPGRLPQCKVRNTTTTIRILTDTRNTTITNPTCSQPWEASSSASPASSCQNKPKRLASNHCFLNALEQPLCSLSTTEPIGTRAREMENDT